MDIRQVGREHGARYVLEGGVRKGGNRRRITAQLIEAETGAHLWADKFDGGLDDLFDLQDHRAERATVRNRTLPAKTSRQSQRLRSLSSRPAAHGVSDAH